MEDNKHVTQYCSGCCGDSKIEDKFELQVCSVCGRPIKPCSICKANSSTMPGWDGCKTSCPLKTEYTVKSIAWMNNKK